MSDKSKKSKDMAEEATNQQQTAKNKTAETPEQHEGGQADDSVEMEGDIEDNLNKELESVKAQLEKEKKEYLFLMAEFDNYKKRTLKEKSELIKNGAEAAMRGILPVVDDMERAINAMAKSDDLKAVKEGIDLIYNKFKKYLDQNGVKEIPTNGEEFNTEYHEAITAIPTEDEGQKGKVIDTVAKGYTLNDKVLRHAKVVVGQ